MGRKGRYSIFDSHLDLAHHYWELLLRPGDSVVDATCGNGHDTLFLARKVLTRSSGALFAIDKQKNALTATQTLILNHLPEEQSSRIDYHHGCHSLFPEKILPSTIQLIVYNLGYLPGGDKTITTEVKTTLMSMERALPLIKPGGAVSITCYPGHPEGKREEAKILTSVSALNQELWSCSLQRWLNRSQEAPSLLFIQKKRKPITP